MSETATSLGWWLALAASLVLWLLASSVRVAFRLLGPVALTALVERLGEERTEFLRKSLRAPTAFWFSLTLGSGATMLLVVVVLFAGRPHVPWLGVELTPSGGAWQAALVYALLLVALAAVELVLPVVLSRIDRTAFLVATLPILRVVHGLCAPLSGLLERWSAEPEPLEGVEEEEAVEAEEVQAFIDVGTREGIVEEGEGELLRNVLIFGETRVDEVMTPRTAIAAIEKSATVMDVLHLMSDTRLSRIPVHEGSIDGIIGVVALKDAARALQLGQGEASVTSLMTAPLVVPESKPVADLLREMQARRQHLALVADEYGGTAGLVTIEDLLEEIVGEIREEHEEGEDVVRVPDGSWLVRGRAPLHDVGDAIGVTFDADGPATVGGMIVAACDRVPGPGETLERDGCRFVVEEADRRRVLLVRIQRLERPDELAGAGEES